MTFVGCTVGGIEEASGTPYSGPCSIGLEMRISDACDYRDLFLHVADDGALFIDGTIRGMGVSERLDPGYTSGSWNMSFNDAPLEIALENNRWRVDALPPTTAPPAHAASSAEVCRPGMRLSVGEDCRVPGSTQRFVVNADGSGSLGFMTAGQGIDIDSILNGEQITFKASRQADDSWLVETGSR